MNPVKSLRLERNDLNLDNLRKENSLYPPKASLRLDEIKRTCLKQIASGCRGRLSSTVQLFEMSLESVDSESV